MARGKKVKDSGKHKIVAPTSTQSGTQPGGAHMGGPKRKGHAKQSFQVPRPSGGSTLSPTQTTRNRSPDRPVDDRFSVPENRMLESALVSVAVPDRFCCL